MSRLSVLSKCVRIWCVCVILALLTSCSTAERQAAPPSSRPPLAAPLAREQLPISLYSVLANPGQYHGQELEIEGFVSSSEGMFALSPDLESLGQNVIANMIYLDVTDCKHRTRLTAHGNPAHCFLKGRVDATRHGWRDEVRWICTFVASDCQMVVPLR